MILYDSHMHTAFSDDSETEPRKQLEEAVRIGLKGVCITDHMDYDYPCEDIAGVSFLFDCDSYFNALEALKEEFADRLDIRIGIELGLRDEPDLIASMRSRYNELTAAYPFDFVIGSVHCLEHTDPYYEPYWTGKSVDEGILKYFEAVLTNVSEYDCFDSCGHLDYHVRYVPKRYGWSASEDYMPLRYADIIDMILKKLIDKGKALECNSAGLKYGLGFAHPHEYILRRYRELGGELITIGSDGHKPEHIAYDFKYVRDCLMEYGYSHYCIYRAGKPEFIKL